MIKQQESEFQASIRPTYESLIFDGIFHLVLASQKRFEYSVSLKIIELLQAVGKEIQGFAEDVEEQMSAFVVKLRLRSEEHKRKSQECSDTGLIEINHELVA